MTGNLYIPFSVFDDYSLSPNARLLYMELKRHADNETGECWPSMERLAKHWKLGVKKVRSAKAELHRRKIITYTQEPGKGGKYHYWIVAMMGGAKTATPISGRPKMTDELGKRHE